MITSICLIFVNIIVSQIPGIWFSPENQGLYQWSPPQTIPGYQSQTWPPILIADRNRMVHAFSYQWLGDDEGDSRRAIVYNNWSRETGWNEPVDILLSPIKGDARLTSAFLDQEGMMHVVFWGGDNTQANFYYSKAPAADAGNARAWSSPVLITANAGDPEGSALFAKGSDQLGVLFHGNQEGNGIYATYSIDGGDSWSNPELLFPSGDLLIRDLQISQSQSGKLHAIWNEITTGGEGRGIYYSSLRIGDSQWSPPIKLVQAESGYGVQTPALIEYRGDIFAFFNVGGTVGIVMRRSMDEGISWSQPVQIFSRHVGVNGSLSLVVDGNDDLHIFFGQRITGNPDIHGMWHSVWQGGKWSEPEPIVSGPQIADLVGDKAFDPYEARAVVSHGNVILVTWRSDPGLKGNGVWYSYKNLDAAELPIEVLPTVRLVLTHESTEAASTPMTLAQNELSNQPSELFSESLNEETGGMSSPIQLMIVGVVPAIILISGVIIMKRLLHR